METGETGVCSQLVVSPVVMEPNLEIDFATIPHRQMADLLALDQALRVHFAMNCNALQVKLLFFGKFEIIERKGL